MTFIHTHLDPLRHHHTHVPSCKHNPEPEPEVKPLWSHLQDVAHDKRKPMNQVIEDYLKLQKAGIELELKHKKEK